MRRGTGAASERGGARAASRLLDAPYDGRRARAARVVHARLRALQPAARAPLRGRRSPLRVAHRPRALRHRRRYHS